MIEFISPSNKREGPGRKLYVQKQYEAMDAGVSLVEIDLNRLGEPVSIATSDLVPPTRRAPYHVSIWPEMPLIASRTIRCRCGSDCWSYPSRCGQLILM